MLLAAGSARLRRTAFCQSCPLSFLTSLASAATIFTFCTTCDSPSVMKTASFRMNVHTPSQYLYVSRCPWHTESNNQHGGDGLVPQSC